MDPLFTQNTNSYSAQEHRQQFRFWTEGVVRGDAPVVTGSSPAGFSVAVTAGLAVITGDDSVDQSNYVVANDAASVPIDPAPASQQRIDLVILRVNDVQAGGDPGDNWILESIPGPVSSTPKPPATPNTAIVLAHVGPITPLTSAITNAIIDDSVAPRSLLQAMIDTAAIADGSITNPKIAVDAVKLDQIHTSAYSQSAIPDVLARRDSSGSVQVPTPTIPAQAARKDYVDAGDAASTAYIDSKFPIETADIADDAITDAKFRDSGAASVIGHADSTAAGPVTDIGPAAPGDALRRTNVAGSPVAWGKLESGNLADQAVTDAKLRNSGPSTIIGRAAPDTSGSPMDIGPAQPNDVLRRTGSGSDIAWGKLNGAHFDDDSVTDAKLRNGGAATVIGRADSTSTGDVADIGPAGPGDVLRRTNTAGSPIGWGKLDAGNLNANSVTNAEFRTSTAATVVGRADSGSNGNVADIGPAATNTVLRRTGAGSPLAFGKLDSAHLNANSVTNAEFRTSTAASVVGRATPDSGGNVADIGPASTWQVLRRAGVGSNIAWGGIDTDHLNTNAVTDAKVAAAPGGTVSNGGTVVRYRRFAGMIFIAGQIVIGETVNLPAGYTPQFALQFPCVSSTGVLVGNAQVDTNGLIGLINSNGSTGWFSAWVPD